MKYQAYELTVELKDLWERAFNREVIVLDFTEKPEAILQCQTFWTALHNYRRKVRANKLNPLYKDEWSRIERATLRRINLQYTDVYFCTNIVLFGEEINTTIFSVLSTT